MDCRVPGDEDRLAPHRDVAATGRAGLVATAIATLLPFALLAVWARFDSPAPWEFGILAVTSLGRDPAADAVRALNLLGNLPVWIVLVGVLALVAVALGRTVAAALIALSLLSDLAGFGVKLLTQRERPEMTSEQLLGFDSFAYPSGHVVRATALLAVLAWLVAPRALRLPAALAGGVLAGALMGYARVALNVHWPTDAIGGTLLGIGWFALTALAVRRSTGGSAGAPPVGSPVRRRISARRRRPDWAVRRAGPSGQSHPDSSIPRPPCHRGSAGG